MSTPALSCPASASRAPYHSTRQVPIATITSTTGASLALRLRASQAGLDVGQALGVESLLFVVFPREGLDHADGRQHFLHDGEQLAFLLAHRPRGLLDAPRVAVHHHEEHRHHRQRDEREAPVEVEHDPDHADQRHQVDEHAEQRGVDEVLDDFDVARDPRDQVAGPRLVVFGERQPLDVVVEGPAQVVPHPLAHAGRQVLLEVRADGADNRDARHGGHGEVQHGIRALAEDPGHDAAQEPRQRLRLQDVVDDDLDGPRLENVRERLAQHGDERQRQRLPVRPDEVDDPQRPGRGSRLRRGVWLVGHAVHRRVGRGGAETLLVADGAGRAPAPPANPPQPGVGAVLAGGEVRKTTRSVVVPITTPEASPAGRQ